MKQTTFLATSQREREFGASDEEVRPEVAEVKPEVRQEVTLVLRRLLHHPAICSLPIE